MKKNITLAIVLVAIIGAIVWLQSLKPKPVDVSQVPTLVATSTTETAVEPTSTQQENPTKTTSNYLTLAQKAKQYVPGHELAGISGYLNLPTGQSSITLKSLVGKKVILIDIPIETTISIRIRINEANSSKVRCSK